MCVHAILATAGVVVDAVPVGAVAAAVEVVGGVVTLGGVAVIVGTVEIVGTVRFAPCLPPGAMRT